MRRTSLAGPSFALALFAVPAPALGWGFVEGGACTAAQEEEVGGRWVGELPTAGRVELMPFALELTLEEGGALRGTVAFDGDEIALAGDYDGSTGRLVLSGSVGPVTARFDLLLEGRRLSGTVACESSCSRAAWRRRDCRPCTIAFVSRN